MKISRLSSLIWLVLLTACITAISLSTSTRGDDPAAPKKLPPRTDADAWAAQSKVKPELLDAFHRAYKSMGKPKLLILAGVDRRAGDPNARQGQGGVGAGPIDGAGVGGNLAAFDPTGITETLANGIGAYLNDDGSVRMVDLEGLVDRYKREIATLKQNDEDAAVDSLARNVNADIVLYFKFTPLPPGARGPNHVAFRCISEIKRLSSATKVPLQPFDWDGPIDNYNGRRYYAALTELACERFAKIAKSGSKDLVVKVLQLADSTMPTKIRRVIRKVDGVDGDVTLDVKTSTDGATEATFEFEYDGDAADFQDLILPELASKLDLKLQVLNQSKTELTLRPGAGDSGGAAVATPEWYLITDGKPNAVQERFKSIYRKNPVRVALVVNWLVSPDQMGWVEQVRQPLIVMQGDPRLGNSPLGPQTINLEQLATQLMPMFQDLGVRLVNASQVQSMVAQQAEKVRQIHNDADLAVLLRAAHACDYVCQGLATAVARPGDEIPYDFKLTNCNNGDLAGGITWPVDARILKAVPRNRRLLEKPENRTRYIAGQMLLALERAIGGGQTMNVEVRNASSQAVVQQVINALRTIEEVTPAESFQVDNGLGTFTVRYSGSFDDLKDRMGVVLESLNHVRMVEMNASTLRLDAKGD